jgi:ankyrin repeat protein
VNFIDFSGLTSLILAVQYGLPGTVKCLLDAGANPNIPDEVSFIVILFCCYKNKTVCTWVPTHPSFNF